MDMQASDPSVAGFYPPEISSSSESDIVCQRCYSLTHYGRDLPLVMAPERYERELKQLRRAPGLVLQVVNIVDLAGSFKPKLFQSVIGDHRTIVVANKMDLLPHGANLARVQHWMRTVARKASVTGLAEVCTVSAKTGYGINALLDAIAQQESNGRPVYCVGYANVGKSLLLNKMLAELTSGEDQEEAGASNPKQRHHARATPSGTTVSAVPGTTLHLVSLTLPGTPSVTITDTPGLIPEIWAPSLLPPAEAEAFTSPGQMKPVTYQLEPGRALGLANLASLHHIAGGPIQVTCFLPPLAKLRRGTSERVVAAMQQELDTAHKASADAAEPARKRLTPVATNLIVDCSITKRGVAAADIAFGGLGWVAIQGGHKVQLRVHAPSGMRVHLRKPPLMPFEAETPVKFHGTAQRSQSAMRRKTTPETAKSNIINQRKHRKPQ